MKTRLVQLAASACLVLGNVWFGHAQGFVNLNFESAVVVTDPTSLYYPFAINAAAALPGWTTGGGYLGPNDIGYNTISLGSTAIFLEGTGGTPVALDGSYSVLLFGGLPGSASITQTAVVSASAQSLQFIAEGTGMLSVSLGGQDLPYVLLSTGSDYSVYGANLPAGLAGQSEQLVFAAPGQQAGGSDNSWNIDDIQFSVNPIPEPNTLALGAVGAMLLGLFRWRKCSP